MVSQDVKIINKLGLHARPAALFVKTANRYHARISIGLGDLVVDAKNVMEILQLAAGPMARIRLEAEGKDAREAVAAITGLFQRRFGESE